MDRRAALTTMLAVAATPAGLAAAPPDPHAARFAALEARAGGRLGFAMLDLASGRRLGYRVDERFRMCSTFKALLAAFVLYRVDRGRERLDRRIVYARADLPDYSPVSERGAATGMTIAELCHAAVAVSDNGAANLLLKAVGGPAALTRFLRATGDRVTRLDRTEPTLNEGVPGDPRDTTSPAAMAGTMRRLVLGDVLSPASRALLGRWLVASTTGTTRIRAGAPAGWIVGDKTGSYGNDAGGTSNDVAVLWPPRRPPMIVAAFLVDSPAQDAARNAVIAEVARILTTPA